MSYSLTQSFGQLKHHRRESALDVPVISLGGNGQYEHVINETGAPTSGTSTVPSTVVSYP